MSVCQVDVERVVDIGAEKLSESPVQGTVPHAALVQALPSRPICKSIDITESTLSPAVCHWLSSCEKVAT